MDRNKPGTRTAAGRLALIGALLLGFTAPARADILGDYTLFGDETFLSTASDEFQIDNGSLDLGSHTATFTGTGPFEVESEITGNGSVIIDMADPNAVVNYRTANSYTGLTTVRSGILNLDTKHGETAAISGDLHIGGGPNQAIVTRPEKHNRELIADASTITIADNGIFELNRMDQGNAAPHSNGETFAHLILDGGTLLNVSDNTRLTILNIGTLTLLSDSVIDLGVAMSIHFGDWDMNEWTPGAMVTIRDWTPGEPVYAGNVLQSQLDQIRFQFDWGYAGAMQLPDGQIVPVVPEPTALVMIPLLVSAGIWHEYRRRKGKGRGQFRGSPASSVPASK